MIKYKQTLIFFLFYVECFHIIANHFISLDIVDTPFVVKRKDQNIEHTFYIQPVHNTI